MLCICLHLPVLGINGQGFWASSSICLHSALRTSGSSPTSMTFPPLRTFTFFFPGPLHLSGTSPSFWEPFFKASALLSGCKLHGFPNLNSACAEAQHTISLLTGSCHMSLLIGGFRTRYFCLVKVLPKFTTSQSELLAASK